MTLGAGTSFNHYCLATPVDPKSALLETTGSHTPCPAYDRIVPPRPAPAVVPGQKLVLGQREKDLLKVCGNALTQEKENVPGYILDNDFSYNDDADGVMQTENSFPGMISSQHEDAFHLGRNSSIFSLNENESARNVRDVSTFSLRERKMSECQSQQFCDDCQIDDQNNRKIDFYDKLQHLKLENRKLLGTLAKYYNQRNDEETESSQIVHQNISRSLKENTENEHSDPDNNVDSVFVLEINNGTCDNNISVAKSQDTGISTTQGRNMLSRTQSKIYSSDSDDADNSSHIIWKRKMNKIFDGIESDSDTEVNQEKKRTHGKRVRVKSAPIKRQKKEFVPTVIEPFNMTIREDQKRKEKKLLNEMVDTSAEEELQKHNEDESRTFKAKEVPKHVNQPIFQNMVIEQPRRYAVGPISRMKRVQSEETISNDFIAKPFPTAIFTDFAYERMKEDIAYRTIRKEIRQKELLASSKLPPRLQSALGKQSTEIKQEMKKSQIRKSQSKIKGKPVPDFERLYQDFQSKMESNKSSRLTTVPDPFSFEDSVKQWQANRKKRNNRPRSANIANESMLAESNLINKSPFSSVKVKIDSKKYSSNPNLSSSVTASVLNATCNNTSLRRSQKNKERLEKEYKTMEKEEKKQFDMSLKQRELRMMNPAWAGIRGKAEIVNDERRQERMKQERELQREYQMQLDQMYLKVIRQPTLFQRQSRMNAKQNAEKKYNEVLKKEGLTEDDITKSYEIKRERRSSKSSMSDLTWVSKPCPISSIKSVVRTNLGSNTISQIADADESCQSLPSEDGFFD